MIVKVLKIEMNLIYKSKPVKKKKEMKHNEEEL